MKAIDNSALSLSSTSESTSSDGEADDITKRSSRLICIANGSLGRTNGRAVVKEVISIIDL